MARVALYGPCRLYYGDPTQASGTGMTLIGTVENVEANIEQAYTFASSAPLAGAPDHDTAAAMPAQPVVTAEIADWHKDILEALNVLGKTTSGVIGFGDSYKSVSPGTLCVLPESDASNGATSDVAVWIPSCVPVIGSFVRYGRPTRNGETGPSFYNVTFNSMYRLLDQTSPTPVSIPEGFRLGWEGNPADIGLTWSLPS